MIKVRFTFNIYHRADIVHWGLKRKQVFESDRELVEALIDWGLSMEKVTTDRPRPFRHKDGMRILPPRIEEGYGPDTVCVITDIEWLD